MTRHHRKARSNGGSDTNDNISFVEKKKHEAYHTLFDRKHPLVVLKETVRTWLPLGVKILVKYHGKVHYITETKFEKVGK